MIPTNQPNPIAAEVGDQAKFSVEVATSYVDTGASSKSASGSNASPSNDQDGVNTKAVDLQNNEEGVKSADRLIPIGPERLRALREAIRQGTYPTENDVVGGLIRVFSSEDDI